MRELGTGFAYPAKGWDTYGAAREQRAPLAQRVLQRRSAGRRRVLRAANRRRAETRAARSRRVSARTRRSAHRPRHHQPRRALRRSGRRPGHGRLQARLRGALSGRRRLRDGQRRDGQPAGALRRDRRSAFALARDRRWRALAATCLPSAAAAGPFARDFEAYYAAGATWNAGGDPWSRDVWRVERTIPGVDATRDELLPFVGPAASLPLWSLLARLPFGVARERLDWACSCSRSGAALAAAMLALAVCRSRRDRGRRCFRAVSGPVIERIALGQAALSRRPRSRWRWSRSNAARPGRLPAAFAAGIQPNLALPLAVG